MHYRKLRIAVILSGLFSLSCFLNCATGAESSGALDGLWSGSWGLQVSPAGVVLQPVKAELYIQGDHVEFTGFPEPGDFSGTARIDADARTIRLTSAVKAGDPPATEIVFSFEIGKDQLTLTDKNKRRIGFGKVLVDPMAGVKIEFVAGVEINGAGDLLVNDFAVHRAGASSDLKLANVQRHLTTTQSAVFLVQADGLKRMKVNEARPLLHDSTPILVAYRPDKRPSPLPSCASWQESDSRAVAQTVSRILRAGTLIFIVPESARTAAEP